MASPTPRLIQCRAGKSIGLPLMFPLSLRKAITEPEKVIAPIATPMPISIAADPQDRARSVNNPKGGWVEERRRADQNGGHADQ